MHAPLQAHMLPGQSQGPGVPTTFVVDYHGYTLNDLRLFCQSQGLTMSGTKPHLIEDLMEHRESVDNGLRRGLFGVISLSLDCGSDFVAWALIQTPALRRGNQDNATFILHACGYEPLSTFNRTPTSFAAQLHRIIENAWTRIPLDSMSLQRVCLVEEQSLRRTFHNAIPESIQGSYDCSLLLVGLFVGIRGNQDTIVAVMNPLKVSIELELGATPEQEAGINANTPAGVAAARRLIKKANAVALVHSLVDEDTLFPQGDTGEHLHIHDICDAILLTYCWFRWTRETLDFAGNPV